MKKGGKILIVILCLIIIGLVGYIVWDKFFNNKKDDAKINTTENVVNEIKQETNTTNTAVANTTTNTNTNTATTTTKVTTPAKLMVSREGTQEEVESKEFSSTYGYTIRYATENFKAETHDNKDWFVRDGDTNCVVVSKENVSYSEKLSSLSNTTKTTVNGYEAVYITRKVEGQAETTYYVNVGKDYIYEITTSCLDSVEVLEGLGHIMDAMVQTFAIK